MRTFRIDIDVTFMLKYQNGTLNREHCVPAHKMREDGIYGNYRCQSQIGKS